MSDIVTINVGGTIFQTRQENIQESEYLVSMFSGRRGEENFIDDDPSIFKHVMGYLRDPTYNFPEEYLYKLMFYGITYEPISRTPQLLEGNTIVKTINPLGKEVFRPVKRLTKRDKVESIDGNFVSVNSIDVSNTVRRDSLVRRWGIILTKRNYPLDTSNLQVPVDDSQRVDMELHRITLRGSPYLQLYTDESKKPAFIATVFRSV